ncbi:MAG TPA: site-specific DNA-methyltransferase [Microthrixaceae bacterium]|nr:site-specific DNA-methyltransferase [Microthrixaceae bacterium]
MTDLNLPPELAEVAVGDLTPDQLMALLEATAEGGIRLAFSGKRAARQIARLVRPRTLTTVKSRSFGTADEVGRNLLIEGDNLQSMVTLYKYRGQVDLILTDPPYNTGKDFRYNDRWDEDPNDDGLGDLVDVEDTARHTKWLKFMWPRLQMMKAMLKPGGVLAICIDHRELFRLGQMLDELFGEGNRLAIINWQKSYAPRGDRSHVSTATEYVLVYAKDETRAKTRLLPRTEAMNARYGSPDGDPRPWKSSDLSAGKGKTNQGMVYAIQSPFTGDLHYPPPTCCWRPAQRNLVEMLGDWGVKYKLKALDDDAERAELLSVSTAELKPAKAVVLAEPQASARRKALVRLQEGNWPQVYFGQDGMGRPGFKRYLESVKLGKVPTTYWANDDYEEPLVLGGVSWPHSESGHSQTGITQLDRIVGPNHGFSTVKPLQLIEKIIQIWCPPDGIVMDPFAGSGTTGHAVAELNAAAGTSRRFILIEQGRPEKGDPYARTLTQNRLRRVLSGDWKSGPAEPLGGGFTYKRLTGTIDGAAVLRMARADMRDTVIFAHFNEARRRENLTAVEDDSYTYLVAKNSENEGFFLVWDGPDKNTDLTREVYSAIVAEAKAAGITVGKYHVYARRWVYQRKTTSFYQIPDHILASFGLDVRSEPFTNEDLD